MNKQELIKQIASETGLTILQVHKVVTCLTETTVRTLQSGNPVRLQRFGTFSPLLQSERLGRNPKTGEPKPIRPRTSVKFKPGRNLLESLNSNEQ